MLFQFHTKEETFCLSRSGMKFIHTRVLLSISIDDGVLRHCSLAAFAEALDQFSGIERYSGIAGGFNLQKFRISFVESSVMMALARRFGQPDGAKLALERHCG